MKPILVTGGAGYIGSHACKALARAGYLPVTLDDLSTGHSWAVKWGPHVFGNIADRKLVLDTIAQYRIEGVIHFAASALVGESIENPYKYLYGNAAGSLALFEAIREAGVRKVIMSSTCATYGLPHRLPISEAEPQAPVNPYGESKLYVERALQWYEQSHGFRWIALRYFNAAGADEEREIGECHEPETHIVPLAIQAALGIRPGFRLLGTDYPTPDGTCIRDFVHVEDLACAHVKALQYLEEGGESSALNLGMGTGSSVREVIAAVERVAGCSLCVDESGRREGDPPVLVAKTERASEVLGWQPRYSNLEEIVSTAWEWHASQPALASAAA